MEEAILYLRVSSKRQEGNYSLDAQNKKRRYLEPFNRRYPPF
jgi:hypothetical protein